MISAFRKIRRQLMSQNRFSKYLLYAIGEIVLVVIGILIAIKINAYNNEIQNRKIILDQLENVVIEIDGNLELMDKTISISNSIINANRSLANMIASNDTLSSRRLSELIEDSFAPILNFQPSTSILNEIIVSGNLRVLENERLRRLILDFPSQLAVIHNQEAIHSEDQKLCTDYILKHGDFKAVLDDTGASAAYLGVSKSDNRSGNQALLTSKEFENQLLLFMSSGISLRDSDYIPFRDYLEEVKMSIMEELNTYK
jgi:hypothetical protein